MAKNVTFILVRLCECEGNITERIGCHGQLTSLGRLQAQATKERLKNLSVTSWFSADNTACFETAEILADGNAVNKMAEFNEASFPNWKGKTLQEVHSQFSDEWDAYFNPTPGTANLKIIPQGESLVETCQRAMSGLQKIFELDGHHGPIGIVTHGEIVRLLPLAFLQAPLENMFYLRGMNGAVTIFEFDGTKAEFLSINDYQHLSELGTKDLLDYSDLNKG